MNDAAINVPAIMLCVTLILALLTLLVAGDSE